MKRAAVWLALSALSMGCVVASCTGSDGNANFSGTGGEPVGAGGDEPGGGGKSSTSGTKNTGASSNEGGSGAASSSGGQANGEAGSAASPSEGGMMSSAGAGATQAGGGGDTSFAGMPGSDGGAPGGEGGEAGAGGAGPSRTTCESSKHCEVDEVCIKAACDEQAEGVCAKAPKAPVCGCDGLTYLDGPLAAGAGIDVRNQGLCKGETATACEGECKGENVSCGMVELREGDCESKVAGICWQLPAECPLLDLGTYNLCGSEKCLPLCEAVKEGAHAVPGGLACAVID